MAASSTLSARISSGFSRVGKSLPACRHHGSVLSTAGSINGICGGSAPSNNRPHSFAAGRRPPPPTPSSASDAIVASAPLTQACLQESASQKEGGTLPAPQYMQMALHRDLRGAKNGRADLAFETFWKFSSRFRPDVIDFDAMLNTLVSCKAAGASLNAEQLVRLLSSFEVALQARFNPGGDYPRTLSNAVWSLARLAHDHPPLPAKVLVMLPRLFALVENVALPLLAEGVCAPRHISMFAWAFSRVSAGSSEFFRALSSAAMGRLHQFHARNAAQLVLGFATAREADHEVLVEIPRALLSSGDEATQIKEFREMDISQIVWAYATLRDPQSDMFHLATKFVEARAQEIPARGVVNIIWSFATLREDASFSELLAEQLSRRQYKDLDTQGCARLLWSLASLPYRPWLDGFFVEAVDRCIRPRASLLHAQDVGNTLWAFAVVRVEHPEIFELLAERAAETIDGYNPQGIANVSWACAKMQARCPSFFDCVVEEALRRPLRGWPPQAITTLSWSLAEIRSARRIQLFSDAVAVELRARSEAFNDVDLATLARIFLEDDGWPDEANDIRRSALAQIRRETSKRDLPRTREALAWETAVPAQASIESSAAG